MNEVKYGHHVNRTPLDILSASWYQYSHEANYCFAGAIFHSLDLVLMGGPGSGPQIPPREHRRRGRLSLNALKPAAKARLTQAVEGTDLKYGLPAAQWVYEMLDGKPVQGIKAEIHGDMTIRLVKGPLEVETGTSPEGESESSAQKKQVPNSGGST